MSEPDPNPDADSKPSDDHELTPMESFFDNLFNEHMVLPQPTDDAAPINGVGEPRPLRDDHETDAD